MDEMGEGGSSYRSCCKSAVNISLATLFFGYLFICAYIFLMVETNNNVEINTGEQVVGDKSDGVQHTENREVEQVLERLWEITESLNILYRDNWTRLASEEVRQFHRSIVRQGECRCDNQPQVKWNYPAAFLYTVAVTTTLGACPATAQTDGGKLLTVIYAIIGIPLLLAYLAVIGRALSPNLSLAKCMSPSKISSKVSHKKYLEMNAAIELINATPTRNGPETVIKDRPASARHLTAKASIEPAKQSSTVGDYCPLALVACTMTMYITVGGALFSWILSISMMDAVYFSFMLLTTTGIPELMNATLWDRHQIIAAVVVYLFTGLTLCSICLNVVYEWFISRYLRRC